MQSFHHISYDSPVDSKLILRELSFMIWVEWMDISSWIFDWTGRRKRNNQTFFRTIKVVKLEIFHASIVLLPWIFYVAFSYLKKTLSSSPLINFLPRSSERNHCICKKKSKIKVMKNFVNIKMMMAMMFIQLLLVVVGYLVGWLYFAKKKRITRRNPTTKYGKLFQENIFQPHWIQTFCM